VLVIYSIQESGCTAIILPNRGQRFKVTQLQLIAKILKKITTAQLLTFFLKIAQKDEKQKQRIIK